MSGADATESPLDSFAEVTGEEVVEAFDALGNDARLAILLALWDAKDPGPPTSQTSAVKLSFSELHERVGMSDSGQFNYHLDNLIGEFVEQSEQGYKLTESADQFLRAVFAGTLRDHATFEGEPIDAACDRCGESMVIDYSDGMLTERCTSCEGFYQNPDYPEGINTTTYRPPAGLLDRTPREFYRDGNTWNRNRFHTTMEGVCPACSGSVTSSMHVCEDHNTDDGTVCDSCGSFFEIVALFVCDICKFVQWTPAFSPVVTEMAVKSFFYERGIDIEASYDAREMQDAIDAIKEVEVTAEEPMEITVKIELDGDRLEATLDDEAQVIDVTEEVQSPD